MRQAGSHRARLAAALVAGSFLSGCAGHAALDGAVPPGASAPALRGALSPERSAQELRSKMKGGFESSSRGGGVDGPCYQETIESLNYVLTGMQKGC